MPNTLFPTAPVDLKSRLDADEMTHRTNSFDWDATELGPMSDWPEALRSAVRMIMVSDVPMAIMAGRRDGVMIYNGGYAVVAGNRHPGCFGQPVLEAWPEVADFNRENLRRGFAGESWYLADQELVFNRSGEPETVFMNLNYSPVRAEDGTILGVLAIVVETTGRVRTERALAQSREKLELALNASGMVGIWEWDLVAGKISADERFARLFGVNEEAAREGLSIEEFVRAIHPSDRERVEAEITKAIADGGRAKISYRLPQTDGSIRWVDASGTVISDAEGRPLRFPGIIVDITEQRRVSEQLAESEMRFRTLADTMPQMVWSALPDGHHDYYNARWYEYTGVPEGSTDGEGWNSVVHPDDQQRARESWRHSLESGEPYRIEYRLRHHSDAYRWVLGQALPIRDSAGKIARWFGTCTDIHEDKLAAEEREVIAEELSHRIKNIFAVIGGIISLAVRSHPEAGDFAKTLRGRLMALGRAHDFVRPHSQRSAPTVAPTSLFGLIEDLLSPYKQTEASRISLQGDNTKIDDGAATPLALLFHELATNAAKYGALSTAEGSIEVTGKLDGDTYRMTWVERGGQPVKQGTPNGFGSRLIDLSIKGQMKGTFEKRYGDEGIELEMSIPIASLSRQAALKTRKNLPPGD
ncbi:PAS domain-containing protein [Devosia sp.]|uniref:PAS domain-containing sensor histidine kinase n=1 Tax=Devosia sp. TaxID=1871048 RepID=UPI003A93CEA6